jgi:hypothetical protein
MVSNMKFDLIDDTGGHRNPLRELFGKLGYVETDGVFDHPEQRAGCVRFACISCASSCMVMQS